MKEFSFLLTTLVAFSSLSLALNKKFYVFVTFIICSGAPRARFSRAWAEPHS